MGNFKTLLEAIQNAVKWEPKHIAIVVGLVAALALFGVIPWPIGEIRADQKKQIEDTRELLLQSRTQTKLMALMCVSGARTQADAVECKGVIQLLDQAILLKGMK